MSESIEKARALIVACPRSQIDLILATLGLTQQEYRAHYPDTPVTAGLALDIMDAKDYDGMTNAEITRKWNLTQSQLNYALYNDNALKPQKLDLVKLRVQQD